MNKVIDFKKILRTMSNFSNPKSYIIIFVLLMIAYAILTSLLSPKPIQLDFIKNNLKENKKVEFFLKEYTTYSREYYVDISEKEYSYTLYLRDIDEATTELAKFKKELPRQPMTTYEIIQKNKYLDAFWYLILAFGLYSLFKTYSYIKLKSKNILLEVPKVFFSDIAGINNILTEVKDAVEHFKNGEKLKQLGGTPMKGLMLYGPPGTGKTLMAKAIAGETGSNFIAVSGSQMVELYVGMGAKRVRELFESARANTPCIVFIDEIDAFALKRGSNRSHSEYDQTVAEMLAQMDGFKDNTGVLVVAATNNLDSIDDALLRPGRFDRKIKVELPTLDGRIDILNLYINKNDKMKDIDTTAIAKQTWGFSGADIKNLVDQSIYEAIKAKQDVITMSNVWDAKNKIQMGSESNIKLNDSEKEITAYHEIGHALIAKLVNGPTVSQVSILPRGQSLGQTFFDIEERYSHTKEDIEKQIKICLGGRVAEKFITKTESTGAGDDLRKATNLARSLVCSFGMSKFGAICVDYGSQEYQMLSEETKKELDRETFALINKMHGEVESQLLENIETIKKMVDRLLVVETLTAKEFYDL